MDQLAHDEGHEQAKSEREHVEGGERRNREEPAEERDVRPAREQVEAGAADV